MSKRHFGLRNSLGHIWMCRRLNRKLRPDGHTRNAHRTEKATTSILSKEPGKRNLRRALMPSSKVKIMHSATRPEVVRRMRKSGRLRDALDPAEDHNLLQMNCSQTESLLDL